MKEGKQREDQTNLVDDAIAPEGDTIARERQAPSDQLHAGESYHDFVQLALEALAVGLADDNVLEVLCSVITDAVFMGKKIEEMPAADGNH